MLDSFEHKTELNLKHDDSKSMIRVIKKRIEKQEINHLQTQHGTARARYKVSPSHRTVIKFHLKLPLSF